jgi:hypothetical protein
MQTFLPYADFVQTAKVLDYRRLGKQRIEAKQIVMALLRKQFNPVFFPYCSKTKGWENHPAVKMWAGHEISLCEYGKYICNEWIYRGYNDNQLNWFTKIQTEMRSCSFDAFNEKLPWWIGNDDFHISHMSNLIRKNSTHYGPLFPNVPDNLPYVWPM